MTKAKKCCILVLLILIVLIMNEILKVKELRKIEVTKSKKIYFPTYLNNVIKLTILLVALIMCIMSIASR
jgi:hypothetical protein